MQARKCFVVTSPADADVVGALLQAVDPGHSVAAHCATPWSHRRVLPNSLHTLASRFGVPTTLVTCAVTQEADDKASIEGVVLPAGVRWEACPSLHVE